MAGAFALILGGSVLATRSAQRRPRMAEPEPGRGVSALVQRVGRPTPSDAAAD
jgi:hypothetical protein